MAIVNTIVYYVGAKHWMKLETRLLWMKEGVISRKLMWTSQMELILRNTSR